MDPNFNHFKINHLDHVAIYVKDLERSVTWYRKVLGLKKISKSRWGAYPIYMTAGRTGVALFPATLEASYPDPDSDNIKIDHFAFNLSPADYELAKIYFQTNNIVYKENDHHFFQSLYLEDPDRHTVELTMLKVDGKKFYND